MLRNASFVLIALAVTGALSGQEPEVVVPGFVLDRTIQLPDTGTQISGISFDSNGNLYFCARANDPGLYRADPTDLVATEVADFAGNAGGCGVDPLSGDVFVSFDIPGTIWRYDHAAGTFEPWVSGFHGGDDDPMGIAFPPVDFSGTTALFPDGAGLVVDRGFGGPADLWYFDPADMTVPEGLVADITGAVSDPDDIAFSTTQLYVAASGFAPGEGGIYELDLLTGEPVLITGEVYAPGITVDPLTGSILAIDSCPSEGECGGPVPIPEVVRVDPMTGDVETIILYPVDPHPGQLFGAIDMSADGQQLAIGGLEQVWVFERVATPFRRGDANLDGLVDIADPISALAYLFASGPLNCLDTGDVNGDSALDIADPIYLLSYLFSLGDPPPDPFFECGPAPDVLGCNEYPPCPIP